MKRIGYIYEKLISIDNCKNAILEASKHKKNRKLVRKILNDIDFYANDLSKRLQNADYLKPCIRKMIKDNSSQKEREIEIPPFYPNQCSHHAIMRVLKPIILKSSYYWSCANIPNRGIKQAAIGVERATKRDAKHSKYCVKLDIKKFYPSINHEKLKECLKRKIKDKKFLQVIFYIIDYHENGLPIGNFTSPWFAELFLQDLDYYIKEILKTRYYVRYADDMVLIDNNKRKLRKVMYKIMEFTNEKDLTIKSNYQLFKIYKNGKGRKIDFVGRCFAKKFTTIRKRRALKFIRQSRKIKKNLVQNKSIPFKTAAGFISRSNCLKYTKSRGLKEKYYNIINIKILKEVISNESKRKRNA